MKVSWKGFDMAADTDMRHLHEPERLPQVDAWFQPLPIWCPGTWGPGNGDKLCPGSCRQRDCGPQQSHNTLGHIDMGGCKAAHVAIRSVKLRCSVLW